MKNSTRIFLGVVLYAVAMAKYGFAGGRNTPVTFTSVSAGDAAFYVVLSDKTLAAFGYTYEGILGDGKPFHSDWYAAPQTTLTRVVGLTNVKKAKGGDFHACAIFGRGGTGKVACWGDNKYGALGVAAPQFSTVPVEVPGINDAIDLALGGMSTCVLRASKKVTCFGYGGEGQMGRGTLDYFNAPMDVPGLPDITAIAMSAEHVLAIGANSWVYGWGYNGSGEIGAVMNNTQIFTQPAPVQYFFGSPYAPVQLAAFNGYSVAIDSAGRMITWGHNQTAAISNQYSGVKQISGYANNLAITDALGNVTTQDVNQYAPGLPTARPTLSPSKQIAAGGGSRTTCSLKTSGALVCEGDFNINLSSF